MAKNNFNGVFDAHPKVDQIYVCNGMPFIEEKHATNHSRTTGEDVEVVKRPTRTKKAAGNKTKTKKTTAKKATAKNVATEKANDTTGADSQSDDNGAEGSPSTDTDQPIED
ncbi:MAG: hypothetical protein AAFY91_01140 [Bacteroidota bacterium]